MLHSACCRLVRLAACGVLALQGIRSSATNIVWADVGSVFVTNGNWVGGVAPANNTTSDIATFGTVSSFLPVLAGNYSLNGLAFTSTSVVNVSGVGAFTLGNGGINNSSASGLKTVGNNLTLAAAQSFTNSGSLTVSGNVTNGGNLLTLTGTGASGTLSGIFSGTGGLTKTGTGTWTVSGANTHTGATNINVGTLQLTNAGALGTASNVSATNVASGATLQFANNITTTNLGMLTLNGTGTAGNGALQSVSGNNRWNSDITVASNSTIFSSTAGNTLYIGNAAYGTNLFKMTTNTVTVDGPGDVWFDSNVGVAGDTGGFIKNGTGKVTVYGSNTFYTGATLVNNGTLDLIVGPFNAGIYGVNGSLTIGDNVGSAGSAVVNIASNTYAGQISPTSAVTINTDGALNMALSNSTGSLTLNGGQVNVAAGVTITPTGAITSNTNAIHQTALISGGTLALGAGNTITVARDASLTSDLTISSVISGGTLTKAGAGVLTLSGANTFTGATVISAGTIVANASNVFNNTALMTVASGAALQLNSYIETIGALSGAGNVDFGAGGTLRLTSGSATFSGTLTGTGTLYIGTGATLTLGANFTNTNLSIVLAGGTLNLNGTTDSFGGISITGNSVIDFGNSANSILNSTSLSFGSSAVTLNVTNWTNVLDYFYSQNFVGAVPGARGATPENQITFTGFTNNQTGWLTYDKQITPAPEPSTYGAIFVGLCVGVLGLRRRRSSKA